MRGLTLRREDYRRRCRDRNDETGSGRAALVPGPRCRPRPWPPLVYWPPSSLRRWVLPCRWPKKTSRFSRSARRVACRAVPRHKSPVVYEIERRGCMVRVEEELKHQRGPIKSVLEQRDKGFNGTDRRVEAMDKRFEALTRRVDRFMLWSFGLTTSVGAFDRRGAEALALGLGTGARTSSRPSQAPPVIETWIGLPGSRHRACPHAIAVASLQSSACCVKRCIGCGACTRTTPRTNPRGHTTEALQRTPSASPGLGLRRAIRVRRIDDACPGQAGHLVASVVV